MTALWIARLEWQRLFKTPFGGLALAVTSGLLGWDFLTRLDVWMAAQDAETLGNATLTNVVLMPVAAQTGQLILVLAALLSLRAFSDDRRRGTDASLLSAPIGRMALAAGKHAGLWCLPVILALVPLLMAATLVAGTDPDWGRLAAVTLGLIGLALTATALALALSAWTTQPALGALLSFGVLLGLWLADFAPRSRGVLDSPLAWISLGAQFRGFLAGVVSSGALVYFAVVSIGAVALAANTIRPVTRRVRMATALSIVIIGGGVLSAGHVSNQDWDWTTLGDNSLSIASEKLLNQVTAPISVTVFASTDRRLRQSIDRFLTPYRNHKSDFTVTFRDPASEPELVRRFDLRKDGEVNLEIGDRQERLRSLSETDFANALQRLLRPNDHLVAYTWGSGERDLNGVTPFDLGRFGEALSQRGVQTIKLDLLLNPVIPDNLDLLIITQPRQALMPGIAASIGRFVTDGGQVLWLSDPGGVTGLEPLADALEISPLPGIVVDARAGNYGIDNPRFAVLAQFPDHPVTREFETPAILPLSLAWQQDGNGSWQNTPILETHSSTWTETGPIEGQIGFDADSQERAGPLTLGLAMTRGEQRVVAIGDADFLSNQYVGIGGNLDLGLRLVNWLLADESLIEIPARNNLDGRLVMSDRSIAYIGLVWLVLVPGIGFLGAAGVWWKRRRA